MSLLVNESGGGDVEGTEVVFEFEHGILEGGDDLNDCSSTEEDTEEPQLNFNGYCFLCLKENCEQSWIESGGIDGEGIKSNLKSFKTLLAYLTGAEDEEEDEVGSRGPPPLYSVLSDINRT